MNPLIKFGVQWMVMRDYHKLIIFVGIGIVGGIFAFPKSFLSGINVLIGFCILPFAVHIIGKTRFNYAYFSFMLLFGIIAFVYGVRMFYFFMLGFYFLFLAELFLGKLNSIILFLMAFMSPFFHQVAVILGFPIRLRLSEWAGNLISTAGFDATVEGNAMVFNGSTFTVDEACMGLSMLSISMLLGVVSLIHQYRISRSWLTMFSLTIFFAGVFCLNVISNLFRIILLVVFRILPGDPMHDAVGIICLVVYVAVPLIYLSRWMLARYGRKVEVQESAIVLIGKMKTSFLVVFSVAIIWIGVSINTKKQSLSKGATHTDVRMSNFQVTKLNDGITKMEGKELLVYVKPIPEFFTGEHTPLLCWKGSGFEFKTIKKMEISGREIYTGKLVKGGEQLCTAWWYSNGKINTIEQLDWRWRMFKGEENFCLVNITASDEATLFQNLKLILKNDLLIFHNNNNDVSS
jgi:exosortase N